MRLFKDYASFQVYSFTTLSVQDYVSWNVGFRIFNLGSRGFQLRIHQAGLTSVVDSRRYIWSLLPKGGTGTVCDNRAVRVTVRLGRQPTVPHTEISERKTL